MKHRYSLLGIPLFLCVGFLTAPYTTQAATPGFEISGWIPYWRTATGIADVLPHLNQLTEINPFGYIVKTDGTLSDAADIKQQAWQTLFKEARTKKVKVIPTVMWSDTNAIERVLKDPALRAAHEKAIVDMIVTNGFDGVDIDYEGKKDTTKPYFSLFLKELSGMLAKNKANKWLMCTIEARTPPTSRYLTTPPADAYIVANDYTALNAYCDRVRLMTYDQGVVDRRLNALYTQEVYAPVADPRWAEKVVELAAKEISKKKLMLGIATYGYEYHMQPKADGSGFIYSVGSAFNPRYATGIASAMGITPTRNSAGELSFSYMPTTTPARKTQEELATIAGAGIKSGEAARVGSLMYAKSTGNQVSFDFLSWSDAKAIEQKVALARKLGLRGVSVFKFDGGQDPDMWKVLK